MRIKVIEIIALVAIVMGLIGFFLNWVVFGNTGETGIETILQDGGPYTVYAVAIFVALIASAMFLAAEFKGISTGGIKFLFVLLSAVMLACALLIFFDAERDAGIGLFIEIAAAVMLFIASVFFALRKCNA